MRYAPKRKTPATNASRRSGSSRRATSTRRR
jgi:hypothetical protein